MPQEAQNEIEETQEAENELQAHEAAAMRTHVLTPTTEEAGLPMQQQDAGAATGALSMRLPATDEGRRRDH